LLREKKETESKTTVLNSNEIGIVLAQTGKQLLFIGLSVLFCFYSWGVCCMESCPEMTPREDLSGRCCDCAPVAACMDAPDEYVRQAHQHPRHAFHFHETVPALPGVKDKELRPDTGGPGSPNPFILQPHTVSAGCFTLLKSLSVPDCNGYCVCPLSEQNPPLMN